MPSVVSYYGTAAAVSLLSCSAFTSPPTPPAESSAYYSPGSPSISHGQITNSVTDLSCEGIVYLEKQAKALVYDS